jgi:hypothetical protein
MELESERFMGRILAQSGLSAFGPRSKMCRRRVPRLIEGFDLADAPEDCGLTRLERGGDTSEVLVLTTRLVT